jgi:hypothetical protein
VDEALDSCNEDAREVVDVEAVRLSRSLWNLRFVVASAGWVAWGEGEVGPMAGRGVGECER